MVNLLNINILQKSVFFSRISTFRQLRYDLRFKEKFLDLQFTKKSYFKQMSVKHLFLKIFNFSTARFFIPYNIRNAKTKALLKKYVYYKYPMSKIAGFVGPEWEKSYKPYAGVLVQHRIMGARVSDFKMNREFNVIYALDLPPALLALAKKHFRAKRNEPRETPRYYWTESAARNNVPLDLQQMLASRLSKMYPQKLLYNGKRLVKPKPKIRSLADVKPERRPRPIYMEYAEPEIQPLKFEPGIYLWHNRNKFKLTKTQHKLRKYRAMLLYTKVLTFPRTRDKSYSKKNRKLLPFNKVLQREFTNTFFGKLGKHFKFLKLKMNNLGKGFRLKRKTKFHFPNLSYANNFIFLWYFTIFGFLIKLLSFNFKMVLGLIKGGHVYVNGRQILDPFYFIDKLNIIHLDLPHSFYPMVELFAWKFSNIKVTSILKKTYFTKFSPPFNLEINYKTIEFFVLPSAFDPREYRRNNANLQSVIPQIFSQWFFPKQKYFGMGKNI